MSGLHSAAETVRARVALADRLRRRRETSRRLWRAAPVAAALCAGVAAGARWAGWSPLLPLGVLGVAVAALAGYAYASRRDRAISDTTAAGIDGLAGLGGELRSASWFAAHDGHDPWVDFHLARAAERLQATDWTELYPPVRARRAKAASAVMAIVALALVLVVPGQHGLHTSVFATGAAEARGRTPSPAGSLPADLQKLLEELLKRAEEGGAANAGRELTAGEVRDLLAKLAQARDLRNAKDATRDTDAAGNPLGLPGRKKDLDELAARAQRASAITSLSPEVRDALADVAEKLSDMADAQPSTPRDPSEAIGAADAPKGDAAQAKNGGNKYDDSSIQAVKDASAGGGIGVIMMANEDGQPAGEPGLGLGGASAENKGGGRMPDFAAALRKETIESYKDDTGEKTTQDIRRKTDRATAAVAYAGTQPAAFDKGRATAPPAVPENRRAAVRTYFIRKP
jgi:hypothetical protein